MKTYGFGRSNSENADFIDFVFENLRKPMVMRGRRVENDDCIVFVS